MSLFVDPWRSHSIELGVPFYRGFGCESLHSIDVRFLGPPRTPIESRHPPFLLNSNGDKIDVVVFPKQFFVTYGFFTTLGKQPFNSFVSRCLGFQVELCTMPGRGGQSFWKEQWLLASIGIGAYIGKPLVAQLAKWVDGADAWKNWTSEWTNESLNKRMKQRMSKCMSE